MVSCAVYNCKGSVTVSVALLFEFPVYNVVAGLPIVQPVYTPRAHGECELCSGVYPLSHAR